MAITLYEPTGADAERPLLLARPHGAADAGL